MNKQLIRLLSVCAAMVFFAAGVSAADATLTEQLHATSEAARTQMPRDTIAVMEKAIQSLRDSGAADKALKQGDRMPDFTLPGADGKPVSSKALRRHGPLVITFYRGAWCPFCNLQLHDLQKHLDEFTAAGATLVAISPQTPDGSVSMVEKQSLKFAVASDKGNKIAKAFGVSYRMSPELIATYKGFGLDLTQINGSPEWELPLAATYVVDRRGRITWAFVDVDYRNRAETLDVLHAVKALGKK